MGLLDAFPTLQQRLTRMTRLRGGFQRPDDDGAYGLAGIVAQMEALAAPGSGLMATPNAWMFPNLSVIHAEVQNSAQSGNLATIYTVPAGRRAVIAKTLAVNTNAASNSIYGQRVVGGNRYRISAVQALAQGAGNFVLIGGGALTVFEAGDSFSVNATLTGASVFVRVLEFDDTSPLKSFWNSTLVTGYNTLYTVPPGKVAYFGSGGLADFLYAVSVVNVLNESGGSVQSSVHFHHIGEAGALKNRVGTLVTVATLSTQAITVVVGKAVAGESFSCWVASNMAGSAWGCALELAA